MIPSCQSHLAASVSPSRDKGCLLLAQQVGRRPLACTTMPRWLTFHKARFPSQHHRRNLRPHPLAGTFLPYPAHRGRRPILAKTPPAGSQGQPTSWTGNSLFCHHPFPSPFLPHPHPASCHPHSATKIEGLFSCPCWFWFVFPQNYFYSCPNPSRTGD